MKTVEQIISSNVLKLRKRSGLTQEEFAERAKIPFRTYQAIEQGKSWPERKSLVKISKAVQVQLAELYINPDQSPAPTPQEALEVLRAALEKPVPIVKDESGIIPDDVVNLWSKLNDVGRKKARAQLNSLASIPDNCLNLGEKKNSIG